MNTLKFHNLLFEKKKKEKKSLQNVFFRHSFKEYIKGTN